jgi:hypothetical protein
VIERLYRLFGVGRVLHVVWSWVRIRVWRCWQAGLLHISVPAFFKIVYQLQRPYASCNAYQVACFTLDSSAIERYGLPLLDRVQYQPYISKRKDTERHNYLPESACEKCLLGDIQTVLKYTPSSAVMSRLQVDVLPHI